MVDQPHRMVVVEDHPDVAFYTTIVLEKRDRAAVPVEA
ncbi:hypothetical protein ABIB54_002902 [Frigoribacterium sp. UYMn621]